MHTAAPDPFRYISSVASNVDITKNIAMNGIAHVVKQPIVVKMMHDLSCCDIWAV